MQNELDDFFNSPFFFPKSPKKNLYFVFFSFLIGLTVGLFITLYRLGLDKITYFRKYFIQISHHNIMLTFSGLCIFIVSGFILQLLLQFYPLISGSGIPQVKAWIINKLRFRWFKEFCAKFFGGLLGIGLGFSLGREGPSVHMGALLADGIARFTTKQRIERRYLILSGAAAGLSAAFNAPLAGVIFCLEEMYKVFSPLLLICTLVASVTADFVVRQLIGFTPIFHFFKSPAPATLSFVMQPFLLIILGIMMGILGKVFNLCLLFFQRRYKALKINPFLKVSLFMILVYLMDVFFVDITGGGNDLIEKISHHFIPILLLLVFFIGKFLFTLLCYGTGFPGGIFLPMLVLGALGGKIFGVIAVHYFHIPIPYEMHYLILGMAALFTSVTKAPITGIVLILEMTGSFDRLFALTFVCAISFVVSQIIKNEPIYDVLMQRMLKNKNLTKK